MKSGVFPATLLPFQEGVQHKYPTHTLIVAQYQIRHAWTSAVIPWIRDLSAPVGNWRVFN